MKKYMVYFEFFGRKMKIEVIAENEQEAKDQIKDRLIFHRIDIENIDFGDELRDFLIKNNLKP